ncbi:bifunctional adenosylcobinamide kinase/adenosylcobinamide-phosphate guanylyltransferase [Lacrimispora amygdalina]|jgi:adenosylcobinamide kinase/adenosylcobinamide-phosphate guanylyltransferase|uniref:bifunctional adenosylcobinamide kinase/adenosylcobinamide-phosphate guanylyltransferase n=1 Tax=Lacrimispora amygdalina TaxID=253257 RepID=UPI000BE3CC22|nr:bifunctional adenosylcobinamide kinase/adenosylcobinamide-phosphate guanylyltransferase [Lacrimispora amygdalina]
MTVLIIGGSGSGKSEYAENLSISLGVDRRVYIATMKPWDEECRNRIIKHRKMREKKQFETVECYRSLKKLELGNRPSVVLLECMSNLVSNELFGLWEAGDAPALNKETAVEEIIKGILNLENQSEHLVIVTNEVFSDGDHYSPQTNDYRQVLGSINQLAAKRAHMVVEVVAGIPIKVKEGIN